MLKHCIGESSVSEALGRQFYKQNFPNLIWIPTLIRNSTDLFLILVSSCDVAWRPHGAEIPIHDRRLISHSSSTAEPTD